MSLKKFARRRRRKLAPPAAAGRPPPAVEPSAPPVEVVSVDGAQIVEIPRHSIEKSATGVGLTELLDHFLSGRSKNTLAAYERDLKAFSDFAHSSVVGSVGGLLSGSAGEANATALAWLNAMTEAGLAPSTRARRLGTLRSLTKLARTLGIVSWTIEIQGPHVEPYRETRGPALDTIRKLLAACGDDLEGKRNRVIVLMLTGLGLRRTELVNLKLSDYDPQAKHVRVLGKGKEKKEAVTVPSVLISAIEEWLAAAADLLDENDPPFICTLRSPGTGSPLSPQGLNYIVGKIGARAGVKVWPHGLRHAAITIGLDEGHDVRHVRRFSRHANIQTVLTYDDNREDMGGQVAESVLNKLVENE